MYQSFAPGREETLLVDIEHGTILSEPATAVVSTRYVDSHPFIERVTDSSGTPKIVAGPNATGLARANGGDLTGHVLYGIESEVAGSLRLSREA